MILTFLGTALAFLAMFGFAYASYRIKQEATKQTELQVEQTEHLETTSTATQAIARKLSVLGEYTPNTRTESIMVDVLGKDFSSISALPKQYIGDLLIASIIDAGWSIEKSIQSMDDYNGPKVMLVCRKDEFEDPCVLEAQLENYAPDRLESSLDLKDWQDIDGRVSVFANIKIHVPLECEIVCQTELITLLRGIAKESMVKISHWSEKGISSVPVSVYSTEHKGFIPSRIEIQPTTPEILKLSYQLKEYGGGTRLLQVDKFIKFMVDQWKTKEVEVQGIKKIIPGTSVNLAMIGPKGSGKSNLLMQLLETAHAAGIQIVKASASSFATFDEKPEALIALQSMAQKGPTLLIVDEANGLKEDVVAPLASVLSGLDSSSNLSTILVTNNEADVTDEHKSNLFRKGRIKLTLHVDALPPTQWKPLLGALKSFHSEKAWKEPTNQEANMMLGDVYDLGSPPELEGIFDKILAL